jgi:hypothetical protein
MTATVNASTSAGIIVTGDTSGNLALQTANTTALTISAAQVVSLTNALPVTSGGTGLTALGTANQVLGVNSGGTALVFSTPSAGAMSLISTLTASSSASLEWTGLTLNKYLIIFENIIPASTTNMNVIIGTGSSPTYITSGYYGWGYGGYASYTVGGSNQDNASNHGINSITAKTILNSGYGISGQILFSGFNSTSIANIYSQSLIQWGSGTQGGETNNTFVVTGASITAIKIAMASGNITSGKASLYGISS